jgi:hypothetical protein
MKPIIKRLLSLACLFTLLGFPLITRGTSIIHRDGYAKLSISFYHKELVGYTMDVSGDQSPYLVVYNHKNNKVAWRRKINYLYADVHVTTDGTLFLQDQHFLYQINVNDGRTLKAIDLAPLSWPPTTLPKDRRIVSLEEREKELNKKELTEEEKEELVKLREVLRELTARLVWETRYTLELLTPTTLFIHRRLLRGFGCTRDIYTDWIVQDLNNNSALQSGSGAEFAGRVSPEEIILNEFAHENEHLFNIKNGASRDIGKMLSADRPGWRIWPQSYGLLKELSHDQRCLINFEQQIENDNNAGITDKKHYALYDSRTEKFTYLDLNHVNEHCTSLLLHSTNVVRYSSSLSYESKTNPSPLWIESYDFTGKRIAKTTLSVTAQDRHLWFSGRTTKGDLIFTDYVSYGGTGAEDPYTVTGGVFVVEVPSLKIKATHQLPVVQGGLNIKAVENTDQFVQVQGNIDLETMKTESQPHQLIVRGLDVYSGKELWRFKEDVVIRKLKDE